MWETGGHEPGRTGGRKKGGIEKDPGTRVWETGGIGQDPGEQGCGKQGGIGKDPGNQGVGNNRTQ